jgi:predicted permease
VLDKGDSVETLGRRPVDLLALVSSIAAVVAPVFLIAAIGFGWIRGKLPYDAAFITTFTVNVSTPCLVFSSLAGLRFEAGQLATMALASAACMALAGLASLPVMRAFGLPVRVYLPAMIFPNAGNLGIPVCLFAFGEVGLGFAVLFFAVMAVAQFTLGPALAAGRFDPRMMLRTPIVYAVALALLIRSAGVDLPRWLVNTTSLLGDCSVPLMLFSLGVALASLRLRGTVRALGMSALRLALGFGAGLAVAGWLDLDGTMRGVVVLQSSMPVAVFNYLWAVRYGNSPEEVAGMVLGSTAMAFVSLPFVLLVVL